MKKVLSVFLIFAIALSMLMLYSCSNKPTINLEYLREIVYDDYSEYETAKNAAKNPTEWDKAYKEKIEGILKELGLRGGWYGDKSIKVTDEEIKAFVEEHSINGLIDLYYDTNN